MAQRKADVIQAIQQAMFAECIDFERERLAAVGIRNRLRLKVNDEPESGERGDVMENPVDRVTYGDLRMIRAEFEDLMRLSVEAGTIKHPIAYETYVDETFAHRASVAQIAI